MDALQVIPVIKPDRNKLDEAYEVAADLAWKNGGKTIRVPQFFQYDGASVPPMAWQLIGTPFNPRFMIPSVFHDWLYHTHQLERDAADSIFHALLIENGVGRTRASLMCAAVESFGGAYWENDADDRAYLRRLAKRIADDGRDPGDYGLIVSS